MQREMKSRCVSHGKKEREIEEGGGVRGTREGKLQLCYVCVCVRACVLKGEGCCQAHHLFVCVLLVAWYVVL